MTTQKVLNTTKNNKETQRKGLLKGTNSPNNFINHLETANRPIWSSIKKSHPVHHLVKPIPPKSTSQSKQEGPQQGWLAINKNVHKDLFNSRDDRRSMDIIKR